MTDAPQPCDLSIEDGRNRPRVMRCLPALGLGLALLGLPSAVFAIDARWTPLHVDADGGGYIDLASIQRGAGFADVWLLVDYAEPRSIRGVRRSQSNSALARVRLDCAGRQSGILSLELRADRYGEGEVVFQHSPDAPVMEPVQTDPDMVKALELVCGQPR